MQAGVIGLGVIGSGVAQCLLRADLLASVFDIRAEAADRVPGAPAMARSPRELASEADAVLIAVLDGEQTLDVLSGPDGVLAAGKDGQLIILLSTISMDHLARARSLCEAGGATLIDCGVTNGPKAAHNGLICLVGASDADLARAQPIFDGFAQSVLHMGGPGAGMAAKLARNLVYYGCVRAGYEGSVIARKYGVDLAQLRKALSGDPDAGGGLEGSIALLQRPVSRSEQEAIMREGYVNLMCKDLHAAIDEAARFGVRLPMVELILENARSTAGLEFVDGQPALEGR